MHPSAPRFCFWRSRAAPGLPQRTLLDAKEIGGWTITSVHSADIAGPGPRNTRPCHHVPASPLPAAALSPWPTAVGHHIPNKYTPPRRSPRWYHSRQRPRPHWRGANISPQVTAVRSTPLVRHGGHTERPRGAPGRRLYTRLGNPLESGRVLRLPALMGQPGTREEGAPRRASRREAGEDGRW